MYYPWMGIDTDTFQAIEPLLRQGVVLMVVEEEEEEVVAAAVVVMVVLPYVHTHTTVRTHTPFLFLVVVSPAASVTTNLRHTSLKVAARLPCHDGVV
jgi:hypothetical protein